MFQFHQCDDVACRFRFPAAGQLSRQRCPQCGAKTAVVATSSPSPSNSTVAALSPPLAVLLDNIRSVYNVGAMLRTADGAGVQHVYLSGITALPTHPRIAKTALGAESELAWTYGRNGVETAVSLQQRGYRLWALEATPAAEPLFAASLPPVTTPTVLVVGNEKAGIDPGIVALCDRVLALPMAGVKASLNVAVAFGVALYHVCYGL